MENMKLYKRCTIMIQMKNVKTGEKILIKDKRELKSFLKFKYAVVPKNVAPLINRSKPYKGTWLITYI